MGGDVQEVCPDGLHMEQQCHAVSGLGSAEIPAAQHQPASAVDSPYLYRIFCFQRTGAEVAESGQ